MSEHALGQAVIGAIVTAIGIVGAVFAAFFGVIALGEYDPESPVPLWSLAAALALAALASFIVVSIALFRDPSRRGWAVGMWIGLGLAILVEGICFGSFR